MDVGIIIAVFQSVRSIVDEAVVQTDNYRALQDPDEVQDSKVDAILGHLLLETQKLEARAKSALKLHEVGQHAHPYSEYEHLLVLLKEMNQCYERAEIALENFRAKRSQTFTKRSRWRSLTRHKTWAKYPIHLTDIKNHLSDINATIRSIDNFYSGNGKHDAKLGSPPPIGKASPMSGAPTMNGNRTAIEGSTEGLSTKEETKTDPVLFVRIEDAHRTATSTFYLIGQKRPADNSARQLGPRLKLWGAGLFQGPYSLDSIFDKEPKDHSSLRQCLLDAFVQILVEEEQYLRRLNEKHYDESCHRARKDINAFLGSGELSEIFREHEKQYYERYMFCNEMDGDKPAQDGSGSSDRSVWINGPSLIEGLFDLLPTIRAVRKMVSRGHETEVAPVVSSGLTSINKDQIANFNASRATIDDILGTAIEAVGRSEEATPSGTDRSRLPQMRRETERIQEFYQSRGASVIDGLNGQQEPRGFLEKEAELKETMTSFIENYRRQPRLPMKQPPVDSVKALLANDKRSRKQIISTATGDDIDGMLRTLSRINEDFQHLDRQQPPAPHPGIFGLRNSTYTNSSATATTPGWDSTPTSQSSPTHASSPFSEGFHRHSGFFG